MPILLSFTNGATAARLDRTASDAEVKEVAMSSLRKMFGDDIPEPEGMLYPRWLSDPWSRGGYSYPGVGSAPEDRDDPCAAARPARLLRRRGDRAGRVRHGARRAVVGRAGGRGDLPGGDRRRTPRATRGPGPGARWARAGTMSG